MPDQAVATAQPQTRPHAAPRQQPQKQPPYHVVLLDDDDHTYAYVILMLGKLFGYSEERAFGMAKEVDTAGRVVVLTTTKERAELKRDQIHAYGPDPLMDTSMGSMTAVIEPAEGDGDADE